MKVLLNRWWQYLGENKDTEKVVKAVIYNDDKLLLIKRSDYTVKHAGEWDLPGGHIEVDEPKEEALRREVKEETGLEISDIKLSRTTGKTTFYRAHSKDRDVTLSNEHTEYQWVSEEEVKKLEIGTKYREAIEDTFK